MLEEIHANPMIRYAELAKRVGVSLGLVAAFMKRCARAELLEIRKLSAKRFVYLLTPKGTLAMMGRHYRRFSSNLEFFFRLSDRFQQALTQIAAAGFRDLLLWIDDREGEGKVHNWVEIVEQHLRPHGLRLAGVIVRGVGRRRVPSLSCPVHVGDAEIAALDLRDKAVLVVRAWYEDHPLLCRAVPHRFPLTDESVQVLEKPGGALLPRLGIPI